MLNTLNLLNQISHYPPHKYRYSHCPDHYGRMDIPVKPRILMPAKLKPEHQTYQRQEAERICIGMPGALKVTMHQRVRHPLRATSRAVRARSNLPYASRHPTHFHRIDEKVDRGEKRHKRQDDHCPEYPPIPHSSSEGPRRTLPYGGPTLH